MARHPNDHPATRPRRRHHRPDALPHAYRVLRLHQPRRSGAGDLQHAGARRAADRRHRRLRRGAGVGERADDATLLAAVRTLAATRPTAVNLHWALTRLQACLRRCRRRCVPRRRGFEAGRIADEDVQQCRRIGEHGLPLLRACRRAARAHRDHDPLQRRLAGDRRPRHGAGAGLCRIRPGNRHPCLGFRNAAAQPGPADGLGTAPARRAAHADRRQRRRSAAGARHASTR
jgi:hypothetical protein